MDTQIEKKHISVLMDELISNIKVFKEKQNIIVDCTLWLAWHASEIIKKLNNWDIFIWFDADIRNLVLAKTRLESLENIFIQDNESIEIKSDKKNIFLINSNFLYLKIKLKEIWIEKITGIYYDLGISSAHIDEPERWFSFRFDWPLDMRFDINSGFTAWSILNSYNEKELENIFKNYWEDSLSDKIAKAIIQTRKKTSYKTTFDLAKTIASINNHPKTMTRIFQALRIEVNSELENMEISIKDAISLLEKQWIIFIISFHSLEDRIVKNIFKIESKNCICDDLICSCNHKKTLKILTKKPILPTQYEIKHNSRSRSAKARVWEKI